MRNTPTNLRQSQLDMAKQLAGLIMDADLPKRLMAENVKLRAALLECKHGAEYPDELGDIIDEALGASPVSRPDTSQQDQTP